MSGTPGRTFEERAHALLEQPSIGRNLAAAMDRSLAARAAVFEVRALEDSSTTTPTAR